MKKTRFPEWANYGQKIVSNKGHTMFIVGAYDMAAESGLLLAESLIMLDMKTSVKFTAIEINKFIAEWNSIE